jgi:hypothetical protein
LKSVRVFASAKRRRTHFNRLSITRFSRPRERHHIYWKAAVSDCG